MARKSGFGTAAERAAKRLDRDKDAGTWPLSEEEKSSVWQLRQGRDISDAVLAPALIKLPFKRGCDDDEVLRRRYKAHYRFMDGHGRIDLEAAPFVAYGDIYLSATQRGAASRAVRLIGATLRREEVSLADPVLTRATAWETGVVLEGVAVMESFGVVERQRASLRLIDAVKLSALKVIAAHG